MMLHLYTDSSPNGFKITIALEELELPYTLHHVQIDHGENEQPDFLQLNPYGRIPVLVDDTAGITLFESAAILLYLADVTGHLLPRESKAHWQAIVWLMFHSSSMGPVLGQRVHAEILAPVKDPIQIERCRALSERVFATVDNRLAVHPFLAGNDYSLADIATFGWTHIATICDFSFAHFPHLTRWHALIAQRPAVQRGITLPTPATGP